MRTPCLQTALDNYEAAVKAKNEHDICEMQAWGAALISQVQKERDVAAALIQLLLDPEHQGEVEVLLRLAVNGNPEGALARMGIISAPVKNM